VANHNTGNIGISFVGCFQTGACASMGNIVPSQTSIDGGKKLIAVLSEHYGIAKSPSKIKGHQKHSGNWTSCPGDNLLSRIGDMLQDDAAAPNDEPPRQDVNNPAPGPDPAPDNAPVPGMGTLVGIVWDASLTAMPNDANSVKLKNATVSIVGVSTINVKPNNAYWEFELPAGVYTLSASAPGYESAMALGTVVANTKTWHSMGLKPVEAAPQTEPEPADPQPKPAPAPAPVNPPNQPTACYQGITNSWKVCFALTPKSQLGVSGYNYPGGGPGSKQYTPPTYFLDLESAYAKSKLAKNFVLNEFMQSWKGKFAVYSPQAVAHWQTIRNALGVALYVNSGFRSPKYNSGLDGAATYSRHMFGDAADVTAKGAVSLNTIKNKCNNQGADYVSVYTSHVHCDWRNDPLDKAFWTGSGAAKPGAHAHSNETEATAWVELSSYEPALGNAVFASMRHSGFDEGIPWVSWELTGPNTHRLFGPLESLAFVAEVAGIYSLRWEVAGYLSGEETIVVR
jgi:hypothetical protein